MGKTRGFFKKIRDTKRTFHANTGLINDRNGKDLTEAEETKMKWQEYTELYKKALNDLDNHDGRLSDLTFTFHVHALEKEMATHSSVLAWRIPGTGEPGGLPSLGLHKVGHD